MRCRLLLAVAVFSPYECAVILDECIQFLVFGCLLVFEDFGDHVFDAPLDELEILVFHRLGSKPIAYELMGFHL